MKDQLCRSNDGHERDGDGHAENSVCYHGNLDALSDGQAFKDQLIEGKPDKITDGICNEVLGRGVAEHGNKLQTFNAYRKAEANRNVTEDISLFEDIAEHDTERRKNEAIHDGVQDDFRFISALSSVIEGDQVPLKPLQRSELLEIVVIIDQ